MRELTLPDVIRHTALWSSDFPPHPSSKPRRFLSHPTCQSDLANRRGCQNGRGDRPAQLPTYSLYALRQGPAQWNPSDSSKGVLPEQVYSPNSRGSLSCARGMEALGQLSS